MSEMLHCDICGRIGTQHVVGWKKVENAGRMYATTMDEKPVEHVCDSCWTEMLKAVS